MDGRLGSAAAVGKRLGEEDAIAGEQEGEVAEKEKKQEEGVAWRRKPEG